MPETQITQHKFIFFDPFDPPPAVKKPLAELRSKLSAVIGLHGAATLISVLYTTAMTLEYQAVSQVGEQGTDGAQLNDLFSKALADNVNHVALINYINYKKLDVEKQSADQRKEAQRVISMMVILSTMEMEIILRDAAEDAVKNGRVQAPTTATRQ